MEDEVLMIAASHLHHFAFPKPTQAHTTPIDDDRPPFPPQTLVWWWYGWIGWICDSNRYWTQYPL